VFVFLFFAHHFLGWIIYLFKLFFVSVPILEFRWSPPTVPFLAAVPLYPRSPKISHPLSTNTATHSHGCLSTPSDTHPLSGAFRRIPTPPSHSGDKFFYAPIAVSSVGPDATSHHVRRRRHTALSSAASLRPIPRQSMMAPRLLSPFCRRACAPAPRALCYTPRLLHLAALPPPPTLPPSLHDCPGVVNAATITTATLRSDSHQHHDHSHRRVLRDSPLVPLASTTLPHGIPTGLITRQTNVLGSWGNRSISWVRVDSILPFAVDLPSSTFVPHSSGFRFT
jgi:hypothetical protein